MFDIGFWEVIFIMVVALLVVGPERLPRVARTAGLWLGKFRGFVTTVKADIDRELAAEELKRTLAKQASIPGLEEIIEETKSTLSLEDTPAADKAQAPDKTVTEPGRNLSNEVPDEKS